MDNFIITVEEGYGSYGDIIGQELAKKLGIPYYQDEILKMASEESGIALELFFRLKEKDRSSENKIRKKVSYHGYSEDCIYNAIGMVIKKLAVSESCVIVGNNANIFLSGYRNVLSVNVQIPSKAAVEGIMDHFQVTKEEAVEILAIEDQKRNSFYTYFTGEKWKNIKDYDVIVNPHRLGLTESVEEIAYMAEKKFGKKDNL